MYFLDNKVLRNGGVRLGENRDGLLSKIGGKQWQ